MKPIGKNIKKRRTDLGMTQDQLAGKLHVTRQAVSNWETGKTQPNIETLSTLAALFGVSVEDLIYGKGRKVDIPETATGTGMIFGGLFLLFMTVFLLGGAVLFTNGWWLLIAVSLTLSGLITALLKLSEKLDALAARIEQLENK